MKYIQVTVKICWLLKTIDSNICINYGYGDWGVFFVCLLAPNNALESIPDEAKYSRPATQV